MSELKIWGKRVTGIMTVDDPEDVQLVEQFNKSFYNLLKNSQRAEKRTLVEMFRALELLYNNAVIRNYQEGYKDGLRQYNYKEALSSLDRIEESMARLKKCINSMAG